jgi:hypothetical protein
MERKCWQDRWEGDEVMRPRMLIGAIIAAVFAALIFGFGMQVGARSSYGAGWWGPGMMGGYGYGMGPWMMGRGMMGGYGYAMGPWMMGPGVSGFGYGMGPWMMAPYRTNRADLSTADVTNYFERWLAWQGNPRLKLGMVTEKDADTITADIVTADKDALVQRFAVNRHTGFIQPSED